jgi:hypothetical protein
MSVGQHQAVQRVKRMSGGMTPIFPLQAIADIHTPEPIKVRNPHIALAT